MSYNFLIGKTYSFAVYPTALLGNGFQNCKVLGVMDADSARRAGMDVEAQHARVYPTIPTSVGIPNDPNQYNYVQLMTAAGVRTILGIPWIDDSTVVEVTSQTITAVIGNVTPTDLTRIKQILANNNYNNVKLTIV
jgi:hypothetical protein